MSPEPTIEIHPYDFAELMHNHPVTFAETFKPIAPETFEFNGKMYHRNAETPRLPGEHFIF